MAQLTSSSDLYTILFKGKSIYDFGPLKAAALKNSCADVMHFFRNSEDIDEAFVFSNDADNSKYGTNFYCLVFTTENRLLVLEFVPDKRERTLITTTTYEGFCSKIFDEFEAFPMNQWSDVKNKGLLFTKDRTLRIPLKGIDDNGRISQEVIEFKYTILLSSSLEALNQAFIKHSSNVAEKKTERTQTNVNVINMPSSPPKSDSSKFDELREYKKLLDEGIISQQEFDRKKKELLK